MEFKSLDDALSNNFIKSLPHLTRLNLTANEIKLIELVIHYTRKGNTFFMGHANIAEHLHIRNTANKAKTVGNIIRTLKGKGYISTSTTHNFNGKNGGSSTTINVNRGYLEQQLHAAFNAVEVLDQNTPQPLPILGLEPLMMQLSNVTPSGSADAEALPSNPETRKQTAAEFVAELDAMDDAPRQINDLPCLNQSDSLSSGKRQKDYGYNEISTADEFKTLLRRLSRVEELYTKRAAVQYILDNDKVWPLETMKKAFESLVLS